MIEALPRLAMRLGRESIAEAWFVKETLSGLSERSRVVNRNGQPGFLVTGYPRHATVGDGGIDDRAACGHRLDLHETEPLTAGPAREPERCRGEVSAEERLRLDRTEPDDPVSHAQLLSLPLPFRGHRSGADDEPGSGDVTQGGQTHLIALVVNESTDAEPDRPGIA